MINILYLIRRQFAQVEDFIDWLETPLDPITGYPLWQSEVLLKDLFHLYQYEMSKAPGVNFSIKHCMRWQRRYPWLSYQQINKLFHANKPRLLQVYRNRPARVKPIRTQASYAPEFRQQIRDAYLKGERCDQLARQYNLPRSCVYRWVQGFSKQRKVNLQNLGK
jgi:hypothetical protein